MKRIIRRKITIKTAGLTVTKSGAVVKKENAHVSSRSVCPVCQTPLALPELPAKQPAALPTEASSAVSEKLLNPAAELPTINGTNFGDTQS